MCFVCFVSNLFSVDTLGDEDTKLRVRLNAAHTSYGATSTDSDSGMYTFLMLAIV